MPELELEIESHIYTLNGVKIPGCTQVLAAMNCTPGFNWLTPEQLAFYRSRGHAVHSCVEYSIRGTLDRRSVDPEVKGYLIGWERAVNDLGIEVLQHNGTPFVETILSHPRYKYGVKPDVAAFVRAYKDSGPIEIKATSQHSAATALQLGAQAIAIRHVMPKIGNLRLGLRLLPEQPYYHAKPYTDWRHDEAMWLNMFFSYLWLQKNKCLKENR